MQKSKLFKKNILRAWEVVKGKFKKPFNKRSDKIWKIVHFILGIKDFLELLGINVNNINIPELIDKIIHMP